ncbi:MAG: Rhodanese domain [Desulfobulbaceae bacterium]|nr:MAG: Rhodanese domain [Desulfobulbaceae bacterium]
MNWKSLFVPGANMSPAEARSFMADQPRDAYQILDVRQPSEYEQGHLPGALLMPVKEVNTRMAELDPEKPLLVYCHSGVRSKAACQLLLAQGFKDVYNMSGGIIAWQGEKVGGGELQGLEFFMDREFGDVFQMANAMEEGLRQLYLALVDRAADESSRKLLERLAAFEKGHKAQLAAMFSPVDFIDKGKAGVVEGGFDQQEILAHFSTQIATMKDILQLGIMLEAQALDLYTRLARKSEEGASRELFQFLAKEEAMHLSYLTDELDKVLAA